MSLLYLTQRNVVFSLIWAFCFISGRSLLAAPSEDQIKALYVYNFTKYVDWPSSAFSSSDSPLVIGIYGDSDVTSTLEQAVSGKRVNNHPLKVQQISSADDVAGCAIIFVSGSENSASILSKAATSPVLTVGENDDFLDKGGIINFVLRDGKVHIDVNLGMARRANLSISSSLLGIADHVRN